MIRRFTRAYESGECAVGKNSSRLALQICKIAETIESADLVKMPKAQKIHCL
ncbi:hypothetical protein [Bartonella pachyuromydis]|uniref:hypothetical protein n=1 Tax=Bartonella pachyuromydis TaxID=931097 RepID=UPI0031E7AF75